MYEKIFSKFFGDGDDYKDANIILYEYFNYKHPHININDYEGIVFIDIYKFTHLCELHKRIFKKFIKNGGNIFLKISKWNATKQINYYNEEFIVNVNNLFFKLDSFKCYCNNFVCPLFSVTHRIKINRRRKNVYLKLNKEQTKKYLINLNMRIFLSISFSTGKNTIKVNYLENSLKVIIVENYYYVSSYNNLPNKINFLTLSSNHIYKKNKKIPYNTKVIIKITKTSLIDFTNKINIVNKNYKNNTVLFIFNEKKNNNKKYVTYDSKIVSEQFTPIVKLKCLYFRSHPYYDYNNELKDNIKYKYAYDKNMKLGKYLQNFYDIEHVNDIEHIK